ncbi:MAG TPA: hypothetical protein VF677_08535 [Flavobacterium sp.]
MTKSMLYAISIIVCFSCTSTKKLNDKPIYTETSGLTLRFEMKNKTTGYLYIDEKKDSIFYKYKLVKTNGQFVDPKKKIMRNIRVFEYHIDYIDSNYKNYEILNKFTVLPSFKKQRLIIYKSHN